MYKADEITRLKYKFLLPIGKTVKRYVNCYDRVNASKFSLQKGKSKAFAPIPMKTKQEFMTRAEPPVMDGRVVMVNVMALHKK